MPTKSEVHIQSPRKQYRGIFEDRTKIPFKSYKIKYSQIGKERAEKERSGRGGPQNLRKKGSSLCKIDPKMLTAYVAKHTAHTLAEIKSSICNRFHSTKG